MKTMTLKPRLSEKAYAQSQKNVYVIQVPLDANRVTVTDAVTAQFGVTVLDVNILIAKGKPTRRVRKGGKQVSGMRQDIKKAYVTVKAGDTIPVFASAEETPAEAPKKAKKEKK